MADRYPGYDVLSKRNSPSWNDRTRTIIDERMAIDPDRHEFFTDEEWRTMRAICARIVPQPPDRVHSAPVAAMVDEKLNANIGDGYRDVRLPPMRQAWRLGVAAIDAETQFRYGRPFHQLGALLQDDLLAAVQNGDVQEICWRELPAKLFFQKRLLHDIVSACRVGGGAQ